jgi:riboflavin kinase/FMN adenylyltransferase
VEVRNVTPIDRTPLRAIIRARVTQAVSAPNGNHVAAPSVIAPGNHDGVHLGHRALLHSARSIALEQSLQVCAMTFEPHPMTVLDPTHAKPVLTLQPRRAELLRAAGADRVKVQHFTPEFAALSPEAFVDALIAEGARALVVGPDFRFGKMRAGDVTLLQQLGKTRGFSVVIEPPVLLEGVRVSSSAIREALCAGDLLRANKLLGRVHEIQGRVVLGDQRGRTIGFPTANLDVEHVLPPVDGVYAVIVRELGASGRVLHAGVANLGTRPTFSAGRSVEVHIFDFDRDIYGTDLRVGFVARVRGEQRFAGIDELRRQIALDAERARELVRTCLPEWQQSL